MNPTKNILVLCTGNSCRSQLAEGYLRHFGQENVQVFSAGVEAHGLNPRAVATMLEDGLDISTHTSSTVDEFMHINFDYILTVCDNANERCPYIPSQAKRFHHNFEDPAKAKGSEDEITAQFRQVREEIKAYCRSFIAENV